MNNSFNMDFDKPNKEQMQEFLDFIYTITLQNPNVNINPDAIYNKLCYMYLRKDELDDKGEGKKCDQFFKRWQKNFKKKKNITAYKDEIRFKNWFIFSNGDLYDDKYIKLYVPINSNHLYEGVNELFNFISEEGILHESKVFNKYRSDNVIIRLRIDDNEALKKIINFIANNKYIKTGLSKNNPFIPSINGIGVMREYNKSYNYCISEYIYTYIHDCIKNNIRPNIDEFKILYIDSLYDYYFKETFDNAYYGNRTFKNLRIPNIGYNQKNSLLIDTLNATYKKYGIDFTIKALCKAINGNYNSFTNGVNGFRNMVKENISLDELISILNNSIESLYGSKYNNIDLNLKAYYYVYTIFDNNIIFLIESSCKYILENYGEECLKNSLFNYINSNEIGEFLNINEISKINSNQIINCLRIYLAIKGYHLNKASDEDVVDMFIENLVSSKYMSIKN